MVESRFGRRFPKPVENHVSIFGPGPTWTGNILIGGRNLKCFKVRILKPEIAPEVGYKSVIILDFNKRIDQAVKFVNTNCSLSMLYFEEPDYTGHRFGPESTEVRDKLVEIDGHLGRLFAGLNAEGHLESTNIIVTSDHGMKERKNGENYFSTTQIPHYLLRPNGMLQSSVSLQLWPRSDYAADKIMKILSQHSDQLLSWRRADIPLEYHYRNNKRVAPIVAVTRRDAIIGKSPQKSAWYSKPTGAHGQSNKDPGAGSVMCTVNKKGQNLIGLAACT